MLRHRLSVFAVSAAALIGTMAIAAPVSAATCPLTGSTSGAVQYRIVRTYMNGVTWYKLIPVTSTTMKAPVTAAPKAVAPVAPKAVAPVAPKAVAPVAPKAAAPVAPKVAAPATGTQATTQTNGVTLTAAEQQMLNLVNTERAKAGLQPLKADPQLTKTARLKSQDMAQNNYFSHQSPTYGSPFDMMKQFGITYRTAGENIAGNQSVAAAHTALMNSSGHRANILNANFNYVGIGIVNGGQYGMMFTQQFVGR
jgi:uncharacterized YkwD family protein